MLYNLYIIISDMLIMNPIYVYHWGKIICEVQYVEGSVIKYTSN